MTTKVLVLLLLVGISLAHKKCHDHDHDHDHHQNEHQRQDHHHNSGKFVTTHLGKIEGSTLKSRLGKTIYAFRGIRYAKPPVGDLRFQPPVPVEKWDGVLNATAYGPICPQPDVLGANSEDCLLLNVFTTEKRNKKRPVIFMVHPGGFFFMGGSWFGPEYFTDQDIVLVTINYRLSTLGFLSTGTKEAPGNNGLKDQVLALKWVKQNIAAFGGDPDNVTFMGYSAGGASCTLHIVSPMSKGLFHKAICMSGSSLGNWPVPRSQELLARKQAGILGCPVDTPISELVACLKTKPAKDFGNSIPLFAEFGNDVGLTWKPVIEPDFGQERFLPEHPVTMLLQGKYQKVPVLTGLTQIEFGYGADVVLSSPELTAELQRDWDRLAPLIFNYDNDTDRTQLINDALKKFYLDDQPLSNDSFTGLQNLYSDGPIGFAQNRAAKLLAGEGFPVYYYQFTKRGRYSYFYLPGTNDTVPYGPPVHHDELLYLFYISRQFPLFGDNDPESETVRKLTTLWANFAISGKPWIKGELEKDAWEPFSKDTQKYMDIGDELVLKKKMFEDRYSLWDSLFPLSLYKNLDKNDNC